MNSPKRIKGPERTFIPNQIIANCLSISRVPIGIIIFLLMNSTHNSSRLIILIAFTCALISDYLDGKIARNQKAVHKVVTSSIGKWLDAFTDFILFFFIYLAFYLKGYMPGFLFALFLAREMMMYLWIRPTAMILKIDNGAHMSGKIKTALQFVGVSILLLLYSTSALKIGLEIELRTVTSAVFLLLVSVSITSLFWYWKPIFINWPKAQNKLPQYLLTTVILLASFQIIIYIFLRAGYSTSLEVIIVLIIYHILLGSYLFWRKIDFKLVETNLPIKELTLPLILTFFRLSSIPTLIFLINDLANMNYFFLIVALLCIVLLSDLLDGKIARKTKKVTIIGTYLDAISDYSLLILLSSTFFLNSLMPWWLWTGIITRFSFTAIMTIILSRSKKLSTIN